MKILLRKVLFVQAFILVLVINATSQYVTAFNRKLEAGLNLGPSNFLGDLGGNKGLGKTFLKDNNIEFTKIISGAFLTFYPAEWLGIRLSGQHTRIEGDDAIINTKGGAEMNRFNRNLNFRSNITEFYIAAEILPTVFWEQDDYLAGKLRPYGVAGIGIFSYNPQTQLNGKWVDLRPLHTEGQGFPQFPDRKEYGKTAYAFPLGVGIKYYATEKFTVGIEAIHRFTTTDYIDDVSTKYIDPNLFVANLPAAEAALALQLNNRNIIPSVPSFSAPGAIRGDPTENDGYYSIAVKLGWRLGSEEQSEFRRARRQTRCYY
jgi:hypothetical protein